MLAAALAAPASSALSTISGGSTRSSAGDAAAGVSGVVEARFPASPPGSASVDAGVIG